MKKLFYCLLFSTIAFADWDADQQTKFNNLPAGTIIAADYDDFSHSDYDGDADYSTVTVSGQSFTEALQVDISSQPWRNDRVNMTITAPVLEQDDVILVSFFAKTISPYEDGLGKIQVRFQRNGEPWTVHVDWPVAITSVWKRYYIPFPIMVWRGYGSEDFPPLPPADGDDDTYGNEEFRFRMLLGFKQTLQIADLTIVNYGKNIDGDLMPASHIDARENSVFIPQTIGTDIQTNLWTPKILADAQFYGKYLPDFGCAGYQFGEKELPTGSDGMTVLNVTDYGAVADDGSDDTVGISNAVAAAENISGPVLLNFPVGTFELNEIIFLKKNDFIVRGKGSGSGGTILHVMRPMKDMIWPQEIIDMKDDIPAYSPFSWIGGVIWIKNDASVPAAKLATVTGSALRGENSVTVDDVSFFSVGKVIQFRYYQDGSSDSIREHVFGCTDSDLPEGFGGSLPPTWSGGPDVWQTLTIKSISGNEVSFKEELNHDVRDSWECQLRDIGYVKEVGFEGFKIQFDFTNYAGHHSEEGYNAVYMNNAINSWIRDVEIVNSDSAILIDDSKNVTVTDVNVTGRGGHYSFKAGSCDDILFKNFNITAKALHSPSFNTYARKTVYCKGVVEVVEFDQHNGMNHQNLLDNIILSNEVRHLWNHGGNDSVRPTHAAFNTSWNLQFYPDQNIPVRCTDVFDGPNSIMIGFSARAATMFKYGPFLYSEGMGNQNNSVPSLYDYQLNHRLKKVFLIDIKTDGTANATISGLSPQVVTSNGTALKVTANSPAGYYFTSWKTNGIIYSLEENLIVSNVLDDIIFVANFDLIPEPYIFINCYLLFIIYYQRKNI